MAKTLIQLANEVGKNLRRSTGSTYTTLTQDQNVVSIVQFINEAKRMVEEAWKWDSLVQTITFDGVAGTHVYDTGPGGVATAGESNDRSVVLKDNEGRIPVWDVTNADSAFRLSEVSSEHARHMEVVSTTNTVKPSQVAVYNNGNGVVFHFPYAPTGARSYTARVWVPQDDLAAVDTELTVPWRPVVLAATALAIGDRGTDERREDRYWAQYDDSLGKAISANSDEFDLIMVPV